MKIVEQMLAIMSTPGDYTDEQQDAAYSKLVGVAEALGASVVRSGDAEKYPFGWHNGVIRIQTGSRHAYDLAHEIGHLMASAPGRRQHEEFGLGYGFSTDGDATQVASNFMTDTEETIACLLAALLLHWTGLPNLKESEMVSFVDVDRNDQPRWQTRSLGDEVGVKLLLMQDWGLINNDLSLTFSLRATDVDPTQDDMRELSRRKSKIEDTEMSPEELDLLNTLRANSVRIAA